MNSPRESKTVLETSDDDEKLMKDCHVTRKRISELREIFRFIDRDNDGTVSRQEFSTLIRLVSSEYTDNQIKLLMNKADMNGDGEMAFDEFVRLLSNESDAHEEVSATREAFEVFDTDNDGYITASELRQVMTRVGHNCSEIEVQEMLSEADQDGDGKVTYEGQKKYKCLKVYCFAISSYSILIIVPI
ncbi:unnamed protein product [Schistosoma mattheei]|uniref:Uncharacterized protein n=1 Tax=Schistosoma mattheei TaxID=31246 RepID=A0A183NZH0_9TREM|nr:unnamed protein product [Schistosoma mattheei]